VVTFRGIGPTLLSGDTELEQSLSNVGPTFAEGNLKAPNISIVGPFTVQGNLEVSENISIVGPMKVNGIFITDKSSNAKINGPCLIGQGIEGGKFIINGNLKARNIDVRPLTVNGSLYVEHDISAYEEILLLGIKSKSKFHVGGLIEAPLVQLKFSGKLKLLHKLFKILKLSKEPKKLVISDINIKTKLLRLEGVEVIGNIEAEAIEEIP